jgi:hypothetical protein
MAPDPDKKTVLDRTTMPPRKDIYAHWLLKEPEINTPDERYCMACKEFAFRIERAHITALFDYGTNECDNFLLLCPSCHTRQEFYCNVLVLTGKNPLEFGIKPLLDTISNAAFGTTLYELTGKPLKPYGRYEKPMTAQEFTALIDAQE